MSAYTGRRPDWFERWCMSQRTAEGIELVACGGDDGSVLIRFPGLAVTITRPTARRLAAALVLKTQRPAPAAPVVTATAETAPCIELVDDGDGNITLRFPGLAITVSFRTARRLGVALLHRLEPSTRPAPATDTHGLAA